MKKLSDEIIHFFQNQGCVVVSTIDKGGLLHNSCKGIVKINHNGSIYLLDLYKARTYENLKRNPHISITAVDEHKFIGYSLKGKGEILPEAKLHSRIIKAWEDRIISRLTRRLLKNIHEEKGHPRHPEALLPKPEYMIAMEVEEIVDLTPQHLK
jgi:nitroimidazol reductase NimA-like FMN-containing flavoprotein (pyridoxamine 5'-phosphate oxidase superfamily)